jgi:hypothetical protein
VQSLEAAVPKGILIPQWEWILEYSFFVFGLRLYVGLNENWAFTQILRGFRMLSFLDRFTNWRKQNNETRSQLTKFLSVHFQFHPFCGTAPIYPVTDFSYTCLGMTAATASANAMVRWVQLRWSPAQYTNTRHFSHKPTKGVAGHQIWRWTKWQVK